MSGTPGEIMPQSHSSLSLFNTCPRQYEARYITREVKFKQGPEAAWGDEVHKALEVHVRDGVPLPGNMVQYSTIATAVMRRPGEKLLEAQFAITRFGAPCEYFADEAWLRGKIDVVIIDGARAYVVDYKTGKIKPDVAQLRRYAIMVMAKYPEVDRVYCGFAWLQAGVLSAPTIYTRDRLSEMLNVEQLIRGQLESAYENGKFECRPSGLCNGWCDVVKCQFWKPKRSE